MFTKKNMLFALLLAFSFVANAQQGSLSARDTASINAAAKDQLNNLREKMNLLASHDVDAASKQDAINQLFEPPDNLFPNDKVTIESDLDPTVAKSGAMNIQAKEYFKNYTIYFVSSQDDPIEFAVREISPVQFSPSNDLVYIVSISYSEIFHGSDKDKKPHNGKKYRVATFTATKSGSKWSALINNIYFEGASVKLGRVVPITGGTDAKTVQEEIKPESYYAHLVEKGSKYLKDNNFGEAYLAFKEATGSGAQKSMALAGIEELKTKLKNSGIFEIQETLNKNLSELGAKYEAKYRYDVARRCYEYANELSPSDKTLPGKMQNLRPRIDFLKHAENLYGTGEYEQAVKEYTDYLKTETANPYLFVGRAKNYAKLGKELDARRDFTQALKVDANNLEALKWKGYFFEQMRYPNYQEAYNSFVLYVTSYEDKADPSLNEIYGEISFLKGLINFKNRNYTEALDSFKTACAIRPGFANGILYEGLCYMNMKEYDKSKERIDSAIAVSPRFGEAHYCKGQLMALVNPKTGDADFEKELSVALNCEPNNCKWNYEMGTIQKNKSNFKDAINYFNTCITAKGSESLVGLWNRGQCLYKLGSYKECLDDYVAYSTNNNSLVPKFYVDLGNVYVMRGDATKAIESFNKGNNTAEADFGLGKAYFLDNVSNTARFLDLFENAFKKGLSRETVSSDPFLAKLTENSDFAKLRKKYKS